MKEEERIYRRCVYVSPQGRRKGLKIEMEQRIAREIRIQKRVNGWRVVGSIEKVEWRKERKREDDRRKYEMRGNEEQKEEILAREKDDGKD